MADDQTNRLPTNRLLTNSFFSLLPLVNQLLLGVLLVPFLVRHLGESTYGAWALLSSVLAYSTLLTLALNSGVSRWVPMLLAKDDIAGINRVVSTVLVVFACSAAILFLLVAILVFGFPHWFNIPAELEYATRVAVAFVGVGFIVLVQLSVFTGVLSGVERYDLLASSEIARGLIQIAGVIGVLVLDGGLISLAFVYALAHVVKAGVGAALAFRALPELAPAASLASLSLLREMLAYSVNTFLFSIEDLVQRQAALILIGLFMTTSAVTEYAMPTVLVMVLSSVLAQLTSVTKPAASRLDATGEGEQIRDIFLGSSKLALMVALPIAAVFVLYGDRVLMLWLGEAYTEGQAAILSVLACGTVFWSWVRPSFYIVVGLGKHRLFGQVALTKIVVAIAIAFAGLMWFDWSSPAVAMAFVVPEILVAVFVLIPSCTRIVGLPLSRFVREGVVPALLANVAVLAALWGLEAQLRGLAGFAFVAGLAAVGLLAPLGFWLVGLTGPEKRMVLEVTRIGRLLSRD